MGLNVTDQPLAGLKVLDFTTLLPGPLATLVLAEAGAEVTKVERPDGEEMRRGTPKWGADAARFAMLNAGKASLFLDLKNEEDRKSLDPYLAEADILVEQFRPGVMARLGLDYDTLKARYPRLIYCSITGYGQTGPLASRAGHDLNYMADTGILALNPGQGEKPSLPPVLAADIGGGTYPAIINILLALFQRTTTGQGMQVDISMTDNLFPFGFWAFAMGATMDRWPGPGSHILSGGSPRYGLYRTSDEALVAVGAIEEKFWQRFCEAVGLEPHERNDSDDPDRMTDTVCNLIRARSAAQWQPVFEEADCCCCVLSTLEEAMASPHFQARGVFDYNIMRRDGAELPALPVPLDPAFRKGSESPRRAPDPTPAQSSTAMSKEW